jgi:hypothetical protein
MGIGRVWVKDGMVVVRSAMSVRGIDEALRQRWLCGREAVQRSICTALLYVPDWKSKLRCFSCNQ